MPQQYQILFEKYQQSHNQQAKNFLNEGLLRIVNHQVSYEQLHLFIEKGVLSVNHVIDPTQSLFEILFKKAALWYSDAQRMWKFTLNKIDIKDWHCFIQLASLRFSQDLSSNIVCGGVKSESQKVWDGSNYSFRPITNNATQLEELAIQNLNEIQITYPLDSGVKNNTIVPRIKDVHDLVDKVGEGSQFSDTGSQITYTYPYN